MRSQFGTSAPRQRFLDPTPEAAVADVVQHDVPVDARIAAIEEEVGQPERVQRLLLPRADRVTREQQAVHDMQRPADASVPQGQPLLQPFPRKQGEQADVVSPYRNTPVTDLTLDELAALFSGRTPTWRQGGLPRVSRERRTSSETPTNSEGSNSISRRSPSVNPLCSAAAG